VLCGPSEVIEEARYRRKRLGGGMRQVGVLAAAARIALHDRDHLADDHALARRLAEGFSSRFPASVDLAQVQTNMVIVDGRTFPFTVEQFVKSLAAVGVLVGDLAPGILRFALHQDVDDRDVEMVLATLDGLT
jgi:threonine aldolase